MAGASRRRHPENPPDLVGGPFSTGSWQAGASGQNQSSPVARTAPRGQESPAGAAPDRGDHPAASRDIDAEEGAIHGGLRGGAGGVRGVQSEVKTRLGQFGRTLHKSPTGHGATRHATDGRGRLFEGCGRVPHFREPVGRQSPSARRKSRSSKSTPIPWRC